jgi:hypothetical protein
MLLNWNVQHNKHIKINRNIINSEHDLVSDEQSSEWVQNFRYLLNFIN